MSQSNSAGHRPESRDTYDANQLSRRNLLKGAAATAAAATIASGAKAQSDAQQSDLIVEENRKPGTQEWLLKNPRVTSPHKLWHMFGMRCPWIEGYCSHATAQVGDEIQFFISTEPVADYTVDIYRMGYYGGDGGRLMKSIGPLKGITQPTPEPGDKLIIQCDWSPSITMTIPDDWLSGVYVAKLTELKEGVDSYSIFIVSDNRKADFLFQCSDMTWQSYNRWPSQYSMYCDGEKDNFTGRGIGVGLDRPYGKYTQLVDQPLSVGSGEWFLWEFPMAYWMEQQGYDVSYVSNWDLHRQGIDLVRRGKGFLSVGHDEYWTQPMFDALKQGVDEGLNIAFLCGNGAWCRLLLSPNPQGRPERAFERLGRFRPRENTLLGAHTVSPAVGGGDWTCVKPDHWLFQGTGMKAGDGVPGLVGWEFHGGPAEIEGLEVVATGPTDRRAKPDEADWEDRERVPYTATIYPGPKGNFVFNAATCWWTDGLSAPPGYRRSDWYQKPQGPDERVQQITRNMLNKMTATG